MAEIAAERNLYRLFAAGDLSSDHIQCCSYSLYSARLPFKTVSWNDEAGLVLPDSGEHDAVVLLNLLQDQPDALILHVADRVSSLTASEICYALHTHASRVGAMCLADSCRSCMLHAVARRRGGGGCTHVIRWKMLWQDIDDFSKELYGPFSKHWLCGSEVMLNSEVS